MQQAIRKQVAEVLAERVRIGAFEDRLKRSTSDQLDTWIFHVSRYLRHVKPFQVGELERIARRLCKDH